EQDPDRIVEQQQDEDAGENDQAGAPATATAQEGGPAQPAPGSLLEQDVVAHSGVPSTAAQDSFFALTRRPQPSILGDGAAPQSQGHPARRAAYGRRKPTISSTSRMIGSARDRARAAPSRSTVSISA